MDEPPRGTPGQTHGESKGAEGKASRRNMQTLQNWREGGEGTTFRTRNRKQSRCCDAACTPAPSPPCIVLPASSCMLHPQPPVARECHTPLRRQPSPRAGLRAACRERGPHSTRLLGADSGPRGLIQSVHTVRPAPNPGSPAGPPPTPRKPGDTPPQHSAQGFCFVRDENNDPWGGGAAAARGSLAQAYTEERAAAAAPPKSPLSSPFPAEQDGKGPARPGAHLTPRGWAPGGLRYRPGAAKGPSGKRSQRGPPAWTTSVGLPPSDRELSRWPRHMRTHVRRRRTAHARPSAPILSPASGYPSAGFVALYLAPRLMPGPVLLQRSRSALWKLFLNALSPLCKALPPFPAETMQRLSSLKPGTLLLRDHQNLFENQRAPWEPGDWNWLRGGCWEWYWVQIEVVSFHIAELQAEAAEQIPSLPTPTLVSRWGLRLLVAFPIFCSLGNVSSLFFFISDFIFFSISYSRT